MGRHLCKNFIEGQECLKCGKPEWAVYFEEVKHKIGSRVKLPVHYTYGDDTFVVLRKDNAGYVLTNDEHDSLSWYDWWELYPIK